MECGRIPGQWVGAGQRSIWRKRWGKGSKMIPKLSVDELQELGFDWPKYALVEKYCVIQDGKVDLATTVENMQSSRAFYKKQLSEAFNFKMQTGADYSDFTDRHDDYARMERELGEAIAYLEKIVEALEP
jgi:hypothetical protein